MKETPLLRKIFQKLGSRPNVRLFRNNVGMGFVGTIIEKSVCFLKLKNYRTIKFGLMKGSGDLIGWETVTVTPEMVGKNIAVFLSIEVKRKGGARSDHQKNWAKQVNKAGGKAIFADDPENIDL